MSVTYTKQQRARAKSEGTRLVTMHVSGPGGKGGITFSGPTDADTGAEMWELIQELIEKHYAKLQAKQ